MKVSLSCTLDALEEWERQFRERAGGWRILGVLLYLMTAFLILFALLLVAICLVFLCLIFAAREVAGKIFGEVCPHCGELMQEGESVIQECARCKKPVLSPKLRNPILFLQERIMVTVKTLIE